MRIEEYVDQNSGDHEGDYDEDNDDPLGLGG
jgi:hypothetical protein